MKFIKKLPLEIKRPIRKRTGYLTGFTPLEIKRPIRKRIGSLTGFTRVKYCQGSNFAKRNYLTGFTLIEMMVVVFVFLVGIMGTYYVINNYNNASSFSSSKFIATYLSQEGIEIVKNIRDNNYITGDYWATNLPVGNNYKVDYNDSPLILSSGGDSDFLRVSGDFYGYDSGDPTNFKRIINIKDNDDGSIKVIVETEWYKGASLEGSVKLENNLYGYWDN